MLSCVLHQLRMGVDKAHGGLEGLGGFEVDGWQGGHAGASLSTAALVIGRLPVRVARNAAYPLRAVVADREIDMVFCPNRKWAPLHISISRVKLLNHVCLGHSICLDVFPGIAVFFQRLIQSRLPVSHFVTLLLVLPRWSCLLALGQGAEAAPRTNLEAVILARRQLPYNSTRQVIGQCGGNCSRASTCLFL